jgi:hypothetical protein
MNTIAWESLPREDLLRRIDGLASYLSAVFERAARGRASRHQFADGRGSLAWCSLSTRDLAMIRRALIEYVGVDPLESIDVGPVSEKASI